MVVRRARVKQLSFALLAAAGMDGRLLRRIRRQGLLTVLNLHRVSPHPDPCWPPLHPDLFEDLVVFLTCHFHVTGFSEIMESPDNGPSPRPRAILSFDDGYYDFVEYAMPILKRYGLTANQNIIPACVESGQPPWTVQLYDFLNAAPRNLINGLRLDGFSGRLRGEEPEHKLRYGLALSRFLKARPRQARTPLWDAIMRVMANIVGPVPTTRMMRLTDVRAAAQEGHDLGAHGYAHDSMALETDEFFLEDLANCRRFFEYRLQMPMTIYAFPNGSLWRFS
jgi:peptidoglycan/xylan/chitin deacetylase (PgdA/CDA1 family)